MRTLLLNYIFTRYPVVYFAVWQKKYISTAKQQKPNVTLKVISVLKMSPSESVWKETSANCGVFLAELCATFT